MNLNNMNKFDFELLGYVFTQSKLWSSMCDTLNGRANILILLDFNAFVTFKVVSILIIIINLMGRGYAGAPLSLDAI
jgi:hypothetical protein